MKKVEQILSKKENFRLVLIVLFTLFVILRLFHLNSPILDRHSWNQISCASTAMNIYKDASSFWAPDSNAFMGDTESSIYAQEFPIYQGLIAIAYKIFGTGIWVARLVAISIAFIGWYYLFKLCRQTESKLTTIIILFIYTINSHNWFFDRAINTDTGMVSFMLAAFYYFRKYLNRPSWNAFLALTLTTTLAGLFKPYGLMVGVSFVTLIAVQKDWKRLLDYKLLIMAIVVWSINLAWLFYTKLNLPSAITIGQTYMLGFDIDKFFSLNFLNIVQQRLFDQILSPFMGVFFLYAIFSKKIRSKTGFSLLVGNIFYFILIINGNLEHNYYQLPMTPALSIYAGLGLTFWMKNSSPRLSKRVRRNVAIAFLILFVLWSGKRAWNHFRLSPGPKIVGDYIKTMKVSSNTKMLAIETSGTRYHEILYYADLKGWISRYPNSEELIRYKNKGVKIIGVHLEEKYFKNQKYMADLRNNTKEIWSSYECQDNYKRPCFVGVFQFK